MHSYVPVLCLALLAVQSVHGIRTLHQVASAQRGASFTSFPGIFTAGIFPGLTTNLLPGYTASTETGNQEIPGSPSGSGQVFAQSKVLPAGGGIAGARGAIVTSNAIGVLGPNNNAAAGGVNTLAEVTPISVNAQGVSVTAGKSGGATASAGASAGFKSAGGAAIVTIPVQSTSVDNNGATAQSRAQLINTGDPNEIADKSIGTSTSAYAGGNTDFSKPNVGVTVAGNIGYTSGNVGADSNSVSFAKTVGNGPNVEVGGGTSLAGEGKGLATTAALGVAVNLNGKVVQASTQVNRASAQPGTVASAGGYVNVNGQRTAGQSVSSGGR